MEDQKEYETWLQQGFVQSTKHGRNYCIRNKEVIGEYITSILIRMQNRELTFRCIAYNIHRIVKLVVLMMVSTEPYIDKVINMTVFLTLMNSNNKELCDLIKDTISFIKNKRASEAIVSLQTASSKLPDTGKQYEASNIIKWVIKMLEAEDTGAALHVMQAVINTTGCSHLQIYEK